MRTKLTAGVAMIAEERARQINVEGYTAEHDDTRSSGELALAAVCYAAPVRVYLHEQDGADEFRFVDPWPFDAEYDYRAAVARAEAASLRDGEFYRLSAEYWRVRLLTQAGALIAAEIDRLLRVMGAKGAKG